MYTMKASNKETFLYYAEKYDIPGAKAMADELEAMNFFEAPASTKYHGSYEGGLFEHSMNVFMCLQQLTEKLDLHWRRKCSPFVIGMLHDLCKTDQYTANGTVIGENVDGRNIVACVNGEPPYRYNEHTMLKGHGDKSVMLASTLIRLTEEEMLCIRYHMGAFTDKEQWTDYTHAIHHCPSVLWTHQADMLAAHVVEV